MATSTTKPDSDVEVTLYWLEQSRAQSILWILEALSVPYELKTFKRTAESLSPPELLAIHPLGKSPVIGVERPGSSKPLVVAESAAIAEYLVDHFGGEEKGLVPKRYASEGDAAKNIETESWLRYRYYMYYIEGSLMPQLVLSVIVNGIRNAPVPFFIKPITRMIANNIQSSWVDRQFALHFPFLEDQLKTAPGTSETQRGGFCGLQFTAADILMSFPIMAATEKGLITKDKFPEIVAFAERVAKDSGYQCAVKKIEEIEGKPYVVAP